VIPIYGFVEGDTIGLLLLADPQDTIRALADRLQSSAAIRAGDLGPGRLLLHKGRVLDPEDTVEGAGLELLDRIDLVRGGAAREGL
jgi:hypothetical protein